MGQRAVAGNKAQVVREGRSQSVRLPSEFRFKGDEVYIQRDSKSGVVTLSEQPIASRWEEVFRAFDDAGTGFEVERTGSLPREIEF